MSYPEATVKVDVLRLYPGQAITLYLHPKPMHYRAANPGRQIEARVLDDGTAQVFAETDALNFERWTSQETESARLAAEGWSWQEQDLDSSRRRNAALCAQIAALKDAHDAAMKGKDAEIRNLLNCNTALSARVESLNRSYAELKEAVP